ncbi:MAG TPA: hypothetical protein VE198_10965 [Actinoallomurus sp.]|nr:hypothetical protein [Actinoallomurus sp.]
MGAPPEEEDRDHGLTRRHPHRPARAAGRAGRVPGDDAGEAAHVEVAGDFPGSPVCLTFHFAFTADGRIAVLTIRP